MLQTTSGGGNPRRCGAWRSCKDLFFVCDGFQPQKRGQFSVKNLDLLFNATKIRAFAVDQVDPLTLSMHVSETTLHIF